MARGKQQRKASGGEASPQMAEAWRLFDAGDKHKARARARQILEAPASEAEAAEARELIDRTKLPRLPLIVAGVLATATVLLILLAVIRY
jgi:hypothetical protein